MRAGVSATGLAVFALLSWDAGGEESSGPLFVDATATSGLLFQHYNGMDGSLFFHEMMGGGGALVDYDRDGDLDVFLVQGGAIGETVETAGERPSDRLFRNQLLTETGGGSLHFVDVSAEAGLVRGAGYGMGAAVGDVDGDGYPDLYVLAFGRNRLLRNRRGEGFSDWTSTSGLAEDAWSVSASFFDHEGDGDLDLFVANYVSYSLATHKVCRTRTGAPDYCSPLAYKPQADSLFRNRGDGSFERIGERAGIAAAFGPALGVAVADFDADGDEDVYVANDQHPNQLWLASADGTFSEAAAMTGVAVSGEGMPQAGMGVVAADLDGDARTDLLLSHLDRETNTFYRNLGGGLFTDATAESGLGPASWSFTGFGLVALDYDNDGWLDVAVANGSVKHLEELVRRRDPYPLHQRNQLLRNLGGGRFTEVSRSAGPAFAVSEVSRGLAVGDVDNDGDSDLLVVNNNGPARLLLNQVGSHRSWLGLRLMTGTSEGAAERDAIGAVALLRLLDGRLLSRRVGADGSYASASDPRLLFGLGDWTPEALEVEIRWPSGGRETRRLVGVKRYHVVREPVVGEPGDAGWRR